MDVIFEIIKVTMPALVVFLTIFYLQKQFYAAQNQNKILKAKKKQYGISLPLRLQAYERLALLCERLYVPSLVWRLRTDEMTVADLQISLLLAIKEEFDYNLTQQIYVSSDLWNILKLVRDNTLTIITLAAEPLESRADARQYGKSLLSKFEQGDPTGLQTALSAVRQEASLLM